MQSPSMVSVSASGATAGTAPARDLDDIQYALLGNPNTGKTTLFNRLCGLRSKTANFPGSTVEARIGVVDQDGRRFQIVDLPGVYGLQLGLPESRLCRACLEGSLAGIRGPDAVLLIADATNLPRNLLFAAQALRQRLPCVIALNMIDLAQRRGLTIDVQRLSSRLGCPVVPISARSGQGVDQLVQAMSQPRISDAAIPAAAEAAATRQWADAVMAQSVGGAHAVGAAEDTLTDRLDQAFIHPMGGLLIFAALMTGLFATIFWLAQYPMAWIDAIFSGLGGVVRAVVPAGAIADLLADGVLAGVAGTLVFLPQICLLFFLVSLLEDTGYLARAAFVLDRLLWRFGLPGQAFVPLLSAHACAIPAIMSTRLIPDRRDRLATILVIPFMSCSARLPVYVLLIGALFADQPLYAGLAFTGCYALGAAAALATSLLARRTMLRGQTRPMVLELPSYKIPSIRTALLTTYDRALTFLRKAGTMIMAICIVLWWMSAYPRVNAPAEATTLRAEVARSAGPDQAAADERLAVADRLEARAARAGSFIGRLGRAVEPVFAPLGYDWQLTVGVLSSFAAREVFVSTMAVVVSAGAGDGGADDPAVVERLRHARRDDGGPMFTPATCASLLVFYVLAMQCLPTLAVTRRESGHWGWAALQLAYMSAMAYAAALITRLSLTAAGVA